MNSNKHTYILLGIWLLVSLLITGITFGYINRTEVIMDWGDYVKVSLVIWLLLSAIVWIINTVFIYYFNCVPLEDTLTANAVEPSIQYYYNTYMNGYCRVEKISIDSDGNISSEFSFVNKKGEFISDDWYAAATDFFECGVAIIFDGKMFNFINTEGKVICGSWFYGIEPFNDEGIAKIYWSDNSVNFVNTKGEYLWENWRPEIILDNTQNSEAEN